MALNLSQQSELLRRYRARSVVIAAAAGKVVATAWDRLDGHEASDIVSLREAALPQATLIASRAAALSAAYLALLLGQPVIAATGIVEPDWTGPFIRQWAAFGRGDNLEAALAAGAAQADAVGINSVISTARRVGDQINSDQIIGWKRTTSADPCEWCATISTRIYKTAESADFGHDRCHCSVSPVLR